MSVLKRVNGVLTWRRTRFWAVLVCALFVTAESYALLNGKPPLNVSGVPIGGDYIAFHTAGRLLLSGEGSSLYDRQRVTAVQDQLLGGAAPGFHDPFRNPPFAALPFVPLALLDLLPGFVIWTVFSLSSLGLALWLLLQEVPELKPRWRGLLVFVFAFAPVYFGLVDGENATVSLLLYVLIYRSLVGGHQRQAGLWAAIGLFKPQLFFLFPLLFVASRRWRALATYLCAASALAVLSLALVGPDGLQAWLRILFDPEAANALANEWRMASLKSFFDQLVPTRPTPIALVLYAVSCVILAGGAFAVWSDRRMPRRLAWAFASLTAVLVDPHLVDYDLTVLVPAGVFAAIAIPTLRWLLVVLYAVLLFRAQVPIGGASLALSSLALLACLAVIWTYLHPNSWSIFRPLHRPASATHRTSASADRR